MNQEELNKLISKLIEEKKFDEIPIALDKYTELFWTQHYPKKDFDEKVSYWSGYFYKLMRAQGESLDNVKPEDIFDKESYENWKKWEPEMDELLPAIIKKLGHWVSPDEVYKRIKE